MPKINWSSKGRELSPLHHSLILHQAPQYFQPTELTEPKMLAQRLDSANCVFQYLSIQPIKLHFLIIDLCMV